MTRVVRTVSDGDVVADDAVAHRSVSRAPWSPAQFVALVIGLIFAVIGGVTLARTGIDFTQLTEKHTTVMGMGMTPLMGMIDFVIGLLLIGAGAVPGAGRGTMTFFGVLMLGFGIIVAIQPSSFHDSLGFGSGGGWFFIVCGALLILSAMLAPVIFDSDRHAVARRSEYVD